MVICLEQGADLHMVQLMPLPLTVSCFSKIQIGFTFLVPAHLDIPGKRAVKRVCVCLLIIKIYSSSNKCHFVLRNCTQHLNTILIPACCKILLILAAWYSDFDIKIQHIGYRTHTHSFNGPFSGTTQVSRYQKGKTNLDFTEARDSEWQWHQLGHMQVCTLLQTDNHTSTPPLSFLQAKCPSCHPTNSIKALKANIGYRKCTKMHNTFADL